MLNSSRKPVVTLYRQNKRNYERKVNNNKVNNTTIRNLGYRSFIYFLLLLLLFLIFDLEKSSSTISLIFNANSCGLVVDIITFNFL